MIQLDGLYADTHDDISPKRPDTQADSSATKIEDPAESRVKHRRKPLMVTRKPQGADDSRMSPDSTVPLSRSAKIRYSPYECDRLSPTSTEGFSSAGLVPTTPFDPLVAQFQQHQRNFLLWGPEQLVNYSLFLNSPTAAALPFQQYYGAEQLKMLMPDIQPLFPTPTMLVSPPQSQPRVEQLNFTKTLEGLMRKSDLNERFPPAISADPNVTKKSSCKTQTAPKSPEVDRKELTEMKEKPRSHACPFDQCTKVYTKSKRRSVTCQAAIF